MDYEVYIDGNKVTASIEDIQINDRQGSQSDDIRLLILNDKTQAIKEGSTLACSFSGFSSGKMNVDTIVSGATMTRIEAISAPLSAKEKRTRHWLKVRLFDIVNDVAKGVGLSVYYQGVDNWYYENVTQYKETDLAFLNRLCVREGYSLKIDDGRLVIFNTSVVENALSVLKISGIGDVIDNDISFSINPNKINAVTVKYFGDRLISYTSRRNVIGEKKTVTEYVANVAEAERFSQNYLSAYAKNDTTVRCTIPINGGVAAGSCISIENFGMYDGKYSICECSHDPEKERTRLIGRRIK